MDFHIYLSRRGLACSDLTEEDFDLEIAKAQGQWTHDTGWDPFIASDEDEERVIDGPEGRIIFPSFGIVSLTSLSISGRSLTEDTDYWLQHKRGTSGPYTAIELNGYATGERRSVTMVGRFGYALEWPATAIDAIYALAAHGLYPIITGLDGDIRREKQGPIEIEYQSRSGQDAGYQGKRGAMLRSYDSAVQVYRWVRL